jgi:hypothetical protein
MTGRILLGAVLLVLPCLGGCQSARFIAMDRQGGVIALPENSNVWPTYYRDKAAAMMREKCPTGYEIVREGEVVTGQVAHTETTSNTTPPPALVLGGDTKSNGKSQSDGFGVVAIPMGETEQHTQQTTRYTDVKEWRIHYRAK